MKNKFTQEQFEELKKCKTVEEAKKIALNENIEFSDDDLEKIVGGGIFQSIRH